MLTHERPFFSIIMATYNRGRNILPSIESVMRQKDQDYELLVIGDGCSDDTQEVISSCRSEKIHWKNLSSNSGSQSAPNNEGLRLARGNWVCYLGHDDIWADNHLALFRDVIQRNQNADFVVSGCIFHGPPGSEVYFVTGLFDERDAAKQHFFPPSSFAHRQDATEVVGKWRNPRDISAPVDADFLLRSAHAGCLFVSTHQVSVHKFAAGHRYLSYLKQDCSEQLQMLHGLQEKGAEEWQGLVETSKRTDRYMVMRYQDFTRYAKGEAYDNNRSNKGLNRPALAPLLNSVVIEQENDPRALDWHGLEGQEQPFRWSGPNSHPKILLPFTGKWACVSLLVVGLCPGAKLEDISAYVDMQEMRCAVRLDDKNRRWLEFSVPLSTSDYTVITLHTPSMFCPRDMLGSEDGRRLGIAIGDIRVDPAP